jgi:uncharacterized protein
MPTLTYPGVYTQEFTPPTPIEGVSTSVAAFLGPFSNGPLNEPTKVVNWDDFRQRFGDMPPDRSYTWYAVRSFYENGGSIAYVMRLSNATFGEVPLQDGAAAPADVLVMQSRRPGPQPATTQVKATQKSLVSAASAKLFRPTGTVAANGATPGGTTIQLTSATAAAKFRGGDKVTWGAGNPAIEILRSDGDTLRTVDALPNPAPTGQIRLADLPAGTKTIRAQGVSGLEAGSTIQLTFTGTGNQPSERHVVAGVLPDAGSTGPATHTITLRNGLAAAWPLDPSDTSVQSFEFDLEVTQGGRNWPFRDLGMDPLYPRYVVNALAASPDVPVLARPTQPPSSTRPADQTVTVPNGSPDNPGALTGAHWRNGLDRLKELEDASILCAPDRIDPGFQGQLIAHCRNENRFAVLDTPSRLGSFGSTGSAEAWRAGVSSAGGYAALYYPWIEVGHATGVGTILIPPSGAVAGIYAWTDEERGVHKAPAGYEAELVAVGTERSMGNDEQGQLNLQGINVIRVFRPGARPIVWGARTTDAQNKYWQYLSTRRLFSYLEKSLERALAESLFKPNNPQLWKELRRSATAFLTKAWRDGALFGERAADAFYVRIDEALNPSSERALGRLTIEIGIRPSYPAEFIVVRIGVWEGGSEVNES